MDGWQLSPHVNNKTSIQNLVAFQDEINSNCYLKLTWWQMVDNFENEVMLYLNKIKKSLITEHLMCYFISDAGTVY